jgi:photosystem II stability/assembly factor-like uncharacterized protein
MKISRNSYLVGLPIFFIGMPLIFISAFLKKSVSSQNTIEDAKNIIFQSSDHGQTWQDISQGLPENMNDHQLWIKDKDLYIQDGLGLYKNEKKGNYSMWNKEFFIANPGQILITKSSMLAFNHHEGKISKREEKTSMWLPIYTSFQEKNLRTIFETNQGSILIGNDQGLFRSTDNGQSWNHVLNEGWVIKIIESNGVLLATNESGIIRSLDDGKNWNVVIKEGGVGIDVANIPKGFAAITYNTTSKTRRVRISEDMGKTWQPIDGGLPPHDLIANIIQVGKDLFCGHPKGIFKSSDKGISWELIKPAMDKKVYNLSSSGDIIYAVARVGGC